MDAAKWLQCFILLSLVGSSFVDQCLNVEQENQCHRYKEPCYNIQKDAYNCPAGEHYHCARNAANLTRFIQVCAKPKICGSGTEPVIYYDQVSGKPKAQIRCKPCFSKDRYNPKDSTWSYMISECPYKKEDCSVNHKVVCEYENANDQFTKNTRCRCDVKNGYRIAKYYDPEESVCRIWDGFTCMVADCYPEQEVSLKGYQCIDKCPAGQSRSDENSDDCIAKSTQGPVVTQAQPEGGTTPRPPDTTVRTTAAPTPAPTPTPTPYVSSTTIPGSSEKGAKDWIIALAVVVVVLIVIVVVIICKVSQKRSSYVRCRKKVRPTVPRGTLDLHSSGPYSVVLSWKPPKVSGPCDNLQYIIATRNPGGTWRELSQQCMNLLTLSKEAVSYEALNLQPSTEYQFSVFARNDVGDSERLESQSVVRTKKLAENGEVNGNRPVHHHYHQNIKADVYNQIGDNYNIDAKVVSLNTAPRVADSSGSADEAGGENVPLLQYPNNRGAGGDGDASRPNSQHLNPALPPRVGVPSSGGGDSASASRRSSLNLCDKEPSSLCSSKASLRERGLNVTGGEDEPLLQGSHLSTSSCSDSGDGGANRPDSLHSCKKGLSLSHGSKANPPQREQSLTDGPAEEPIAPELTQKSGTGLVGRNRRLSRSTSDVTREKEMPVKTEGDDKERLKSSSLHDVPLILMHECLCPDKKTEMMKYAIDLCISYLKENMDPKLVFDKFQEKMMFPFMTVRDMKEKELTTDKNDKILEHVRRSGWDAYIKFKTILKETKQDECVKQLQNKELCFIKDEYRRPEEHDGETAEKGGSYIDDTNEAPGDTTCPNDRLEEVKAEESLKQLAKCTTIKEFQTEADRICRPDVPIIEQTYEPWCTQKIHMNNCPPGFDSYGSSGQESSCLYQSVSILLTGHEAWHKRLRLLAALYGATHLQDITAQIKDRLRDKSEDYTKSFFVSMMKSSVDEEGNEEQTIEKDVEKIIMETAALGVDSCRLHVYLLSRALDRPIKSYYQTDHHGKDQDNILNTDAEGDKEPLNIMWVNHQNNTNRPLNHVIPLKPHARQTEQS